MMDQQDHNKRSGGAETAATEVLLPPIPGENHVSALLGAQIREVNQENTLGCREKTIYGLKRLNEEV